MNTTQTKIYIELIIGSSQYISEKFEDSNEGIELAKKRILDFKYSQFPSLRGIELILKRITITEEIIL